MSEKRTTETTTERVEQPGTIPTTEEALNRMQTPTETVERKTVETTTEED